MTGYTPPTTGTPNWDGPLNDIIEEIDLDMQARPRDEDVVHATGAEVISGVKNFAHGITVPPASLPITAIALLQSTLEALASGNGRVRASLVHTTGSLAADTSQATTIALPPAFMVYRLAVTRPARVRLYATTAQRDADASRAFGTIPTGDHGVILDCLLPAAGSLDIMPPVPGANLDTGNVALSVTNKDVSTGTVGVTFTYLRME